VAFEDDVIRRVHGDMILNGSFGVLMPKAPQVQLSSGAEVEVQRLIMNLLPIPGLDGGRIVFVLIELVGT